MSASGETDKASKDEEKRMWTQELYRLLNQIKVKKVRKQTQELKWKPETQENIDSVATHSEQIFKGDTL